MVDEQGTRYCAICGDEIEWTRARNARLCRGCASGKRKRTCKVCGREFRTFTGTMCPGCVKEHLREIAKKRETEKRAKRELLAGAKRVETSPRALVEAGVNSGAATAPSMLTPDVILSLRLRLSMSQSEFGRALGALRGVPYGRSYVAKLEGGAFPITQAIRRAIQALATPTAHLNVLPAKVYAAQDLPPGTIVLGRPVVCPSCRRVYVMPWPTQVYCSALCKRAARRERTKTTQKNEEGGVENERG